jgi:hypothetical protein
VDLAKVKEEEAMPGEPTLKYNNKLLRIRQIIGNSIWLKVTNNPKIKRINRNNIKLNNPCDKIVNNRFN